VLERVWEGHSEFLHVLPLPPHRNIPLLALSAIVLLWVILTACGLHLIANCQAPRLLMDAIWIVVPTGVLSIGGAGAWLVSAEIRAVRERRAKLEKIRPTMEVIPLERWKPPELTRWQKNRRQVVVTVSKRRVRKLPPICPAMSRRRALGLGTDRIVTGNRRRKK
jgi:hypothetical protein